MLEPNIAPPMTLPSPEPSSRGTPSCGVACGTLGDSDKSAARPYESLTCGLPRCTIRTCMRTVKNVPGRSTKPACGGADRSACNQQFCQHASASAPDIDSEPGEEAVDLLTDFQKSHRAEEPEKDVPGDSLVAGRGDGSSPLPTLQWQMPACRVREIEP